jgi:hypothetical protein
MTAPPRARTASSRADLAAAGVAFGLVAAAAVTAAVLYLAGHPVHASAAPLFAHWRPHVGAGTPLAVGVAVLVVWHGPRLADRLPWGRLLAFGYAAAVAWTLSLALVDGWRRGLAGRLATSHEYLAEVGTAAVVRGFTERILDGQPDSWTTHVAGHPPGALLVFVGLDRAGLGGGGWAALACVLVGGLAAVAVPVTVRLLGDDAAARTAVPYAVLFPGAVWVGASADGLFAGVTACGVALVALGLTRRAWWAALAGGAVLAFGAHLSYGLVLLAPVVLAAVAVARRFRPLAWSLAGAAAVVAAFTVGGFWWFDGYELVVQRYYQGIASDRAYGYWVWANLAALALSAGPAAAAVLRRAAVSGSGAARLLPLGAAVAVLAADLSGLSKAEVERIWLPFAVWFAAGAALLPAPHRRAWLAAQAGTALLVNHLLLTVW